MRCWLSTIQAQPAAKRLLDIARLWPMSVSRFNPGMIGMPVSETYAYRFRLSPARHWTYCVAHGADTPRSPWVTSMYEHTNNGRETAPGGLRGRLAAVTGSAVL